MNRYFSDQDYELLTAYIDDELSPADRQRLEQRLATDTQLRAEMESLRETSAIIRTLPPLTAPRDFTLTPDIARRSARPNRLIRFTTSPVFSTLSAAAAVFLLLAGSLLLLGIPSRPSADMLNVAALPTPLPAATTTLPEAADDMRALPTMTAPPTATIMRQTEADSVGAAGAAEVTPTMTVEATAMAFESAPAGEEESGEMTDEAIEASPWPTQSGFTPTPQPQPQQAEPLVTTIALGFALIGLGLVLLFLALFTLWLRRSRRR